MESEEKNNNTQGKAVAREEKINVKEPIQNEDSAATLEDTLKSKIKKLWHTQTWILAYEDSGIERQDLYELEKEQESKIDQLKGKIGSHKFYRIIFNLQWTNMKTLQDRLDKERNVKDEKKEDTKMEQ